MLKDNQIKAWFTPKRIRNIVIVAGFIAGIVFLSRMDSCRNKFKDQQGTIDSLTMANQALIRDRNKFAQEILVQKVVITSNQEDLRKMADTLFNLKRKDEKQIKQINALVKLTSSTGIKEIKIPFLDTNKMKIFSDSLEKQCAEVIKFYRDSSIQVPMPIKMDSADFHFAGEVEKDGLKIDSLSFPDVQTIAFEETKGGFFKRDITKKLRFYKKSELIVRVKHTNKHITTTGMSSVVYQSKIKGRWLERATIFAAGVFIGNRIR